MAFEPSLYNLSQHRFLQASGRWMSFYVLAEQDRQIHAAIHFYVEGQVAKSPARAPYGSLECSASVRVEILAEFLTFINSTLASLNISLVEVLHYPSIYGHEDNNVPAAFRLAGYTIFEEQITSVIPITEAVKSPLIERAKNRKVKKARVAGLRFEQLSLLFLKPAYEFLLRCRAPKGYRLSMSYEMLKMTIEKFPDHFYIFGIFDEKNLVAVAITVRPKGNVLYDFYRDHNPQFNQISPGVLLVEEMYNFALHNGIQWLDLGTSSPNGMIKHSLLEFKTSLGAKPFSKFSYRKMLE